MVVPWVEVYPWANSGSTMCGAAGLISRTIARAIAAPIIASMVVVAVVV